MSEPDPSALDPYYQQAREAGRELITLIKIAEEQGSDPDGHIIRGQIRQYVRDNGPTQVWLLIEVLARSVAATYDDLADWSASVIQAETEKDA